MDEAEQCLSQRSLDKWSDDRWLADPNSRTIICSLFSPTSHLAKPHLTAFPLLANYHRHHCPLYTNGCSYAERQHHPQRGVYQWLCCHGEDPDDRIHGTGVSHFRCIPLRSAKSAQVHHRRQYAQGYVAIDSHEHSHHYSRYRSTHC